MPAACFRLSQGSFRLTGPGSRGHGGRVQPVRHDPIMILPPVSMDVGLLLISIGVVNLWRSRSSAG